MKNPPTDSKGDRSPYAVTPEGIVFLRPTRDGLVEQRLSNFTAQIVEEVISDDGVSERGELVVAGELAGGMSLPRIRIPMARFASMDWPLQQWGASVIVSAGVGSKDRLREAIQWLSPDVHRKTIYTHPGWRELPDHGWCYLHASGAIAASGPVNDVNVALHGVAARISLPVPPAGDELGNAVRASLALLDLAPDVIMAPVLAAVYRAVLATFLPADLALFIVGPTGVFKSELAAVAMQHFGTGFDRVHLPAQWAATSNYLERLCFDYKDTVTVIDDFAPTGSSLEVARLQATAERVLRGVGNHGGRGRMNADGSLRPDFPPRGLVLGTGEDVPRGQSLRARLLVVEIGPGDIDRDALTVAQGAGRSGILVAGLAGYIQWIAANLEELRASLPGRLTAFRSRALSEGGHARTPEAIAHLAIGWWTFLEFAVAIEALSRDAADRLLTRIWRALREAALSQAAHQAGEGPAQRFLDLFGSALAGGFAHLASENGGIPSQPESWGWLKAPHDHGFIERAEWHPQGVRAGWVANDGIYLDLESALTAVQKVGQASGNPIAVGSKTLAKRLQEGGFLSSTSQAQGELRVRRTIQGRRRRVLHLNANAITPEESGQPGQSARLTADGAPSGGVPESFGRVLRPDFGDHPGESGQDIRPLLGIELHDGRNQQEPDTELANQLHIPGEVFLVDDDKASEVVA